MLDKSHKKRLNLFFSGVLLFNDCLVVIIAFSFSYWLRFYSNFFVAPLGVPSRQDYFVPLAFIIMILIAVVNANGLYTPDPIRKFVDVIAVLFKSSCVTMLIVLTGTFFYRDISFSRLLIFIIWVSLSLLLILTRYILREIYKKKILPKVKKKIIFIGSPHAVESVIATMGHFHKYGYAAGTISHQKHIQQSSAKVLLLGTIDQFADIVDNKKPDEVILADLTIPRKTVMSLILEAEKRMIPFKIVADLYDIMIRQFELENIDGVNLIKIKESPLNYVYNRLLKRLLDISIAVFFLIIFLPLFLIVPLWIKLDSHGKVFFAQERVSEGGRIFRIFKFRTMIENAEAASGPVFTAENDLRCTRAGKFLRRFNLDELPQLWNVLKGDMSLVGPRPERPHFVNQFKDGIPRYMSRHHVKSGITGWAQVNGLRQATPIEERVKYDLYYLENWSLWFDIKILLQSLFALKNAY